MRGALSHLTRLQGVALKQRDNFTFIIISKSVSYLKLPHLKGFPHQILCTFIFPVRPVPNMVGAPPNLTKDFCGFSPVISGQYLQMDTITFPYCFYNSPGYHPIFMSEVK
jgi:hypothetical protein